MIVLIICYKGSRKKANGQLFSKKQLLAASFFSFLGRKRKNDTFFSFFTLFICIFAIEI